MPGPQRLRSRRVVHKSTGGTLNAILEPVDPVGNAPSVSLNTVAHPHPLPTQGEGIRIKKANWKRAARIELASGRAGGFSDCAGYFGGHCFYLGGVFAFY